MHGISKHSDRDNEVERIFKLAEVQKLFYEINSHFSSKTKGEIFSASRKVLLLQPDDVNCWHARKRALIRDYLAQDHCSATDAIMYLGIDARNEELELTLLALKENPKAYSAWHHRQWCLSPLRAGSWRPLSGPPLKDANWSQEINLLTKLLAIDCRNCKFGTGLILLVHAWKYLMWVYQQTKTGDLLKNPLTDAVGRDIATAPLQDIVTDSLKANFSNYSAWHYQHVLDGSSSQDIHENLEFCRNAIFTAPNDHSAWFYYWKLVKKLELATLLEEVHLLYALWEEESASFMVPLAIFQICQNLPNDIEIKPGVKKEELLDSILFSLKEIDPTRSGMYDEFTFDLHK